MGRNRFINLANAQQFTAIQFLSDPGYDPSDRHIPSCVQVRWNFAVVSGVSAHVVTHARYGSGFTPTTAVANSILSALGGGLSSTGVLGFMATQTSLTGISLRDLNVENQPFVDSNGAAHPGTGTGSAQPSEVAVVLTLRTALVGQANRGRIFLPGWSTNALGANDTIAGPAVTALDNFASGLAQVYSDNALTLVLGHFSRIAYTGVNGKPHEARPPGTVDVTGVLLRDNHWDTQRRRGLG